MAQRAPRATADPAPDLDYPLDHVLELDQTVSKRFRATSFKNAQLNAPGYGSHRTVRTARGATGWPISEQSHAIIEYMNTHGPVTAHTIHADAIAPRWPKWGPAQTRARVQSLVSSGRMKRTQAGMFVRMPDTAKTKEVPP